MLAGRLWWPALNACFKIPKVEAHLPMEGENTSVDSTTMPQARILSICVLSVTAQKMPCRRFTYMNKYSSRAWSSTCGNLRQPCSPSKSSLG
jgi:hypothetical protein